MIRVGHWGNSSLCVFGEDQTRTGLEPAELSCPSLSPAQVLQKHAEPRGLAFVTKALASILQEYCLLTAIEPLGDIVPRMIELGFNHGNC